MFVDHFFPPILARGLFPKLLDKTLVFDLESKSYRSRLTGGTVGELSFVLSTLSSDKYRFNPENKKMS